MSHQHHDTKGTHPSEVHRDLHLVTPNVHGEDVRHLQEAANSELIHRQLEFLAVPADSDYGLHTREVVAKAAFAVGLSGSAIKHIHTGEITQRVQHLIRNPQDRSELARLREDHRKHELEQWRHNHSTGPAAAVAWAVSKDGQHEEGSSNWGGVVTEVLSYWGIGPNPWCGAFAGYAVKKIGSAKIDGLWCPYSGSIGAAARAGQHGVIAVSPGNAKIGDLVTFFGPANNDHVGLVRAKPSGDLLPTVEGNTSPDAHGSQNNGGSVALKERSISAEVSVVAHITNW